MRVQSMRKIGCFNQNNKTNSARSAGIFLCLTRYSQTNFKHTSAICDQICVIHKLISSVLVQSLHKIRESVCKPCAKNPRIRVRSVHKIRGAHPCTKSRDTKKTEKLARRGRRSNSHVFSCDKVSSFGRFPAWGHPKGLFYPQSSNNTRQF